MVSFKAPNLKLDIMIFFYVSYSMNIPSLPFTLLKEIIMEPYSQSWLHSLFLEFTSLSFFPFPRLLVK